LAFFPHALVALRIGARAALSTPGKLLQCKSNAAEEICLEVKAAEILCLMWLQSGD